MSMPTDSVRTNSHAKRQSSLRRGNRRSPTDAELVHQWQAGSVTAGTALLRRHEHMLRRFFKGRFEESAEDLIQQTMLVCTRNIGQVNDAERFPSYLVGVAKRVSFQHLRKKRVRTSSHDALSHEPEAKDETPSAVTSLRERGSHLIRAVRTLPPEWQLAVVLYYWHGMAVAEIAQIQDVAEGTVKSWLARARSMLRRRLSILLPKTQP